MDISIDSHFLVSCLYRQEMLAQGLDPNPPTRQDHEKVPFPKYEEYQVGDGQMQIDFICLCLRATLVWTVQIR